MAFQNVILTSFMPNLGAEADIVKVRAGYARNYLLPQGLATLATKGNVKQIELEREALLKKAAVERATAEAQKDQMGVIELAFERKAGEGGTLFGSVTSMDIAESLQSKGYEIDRRKIALRDAIKETGEYKVKVRLHRDVVLEVPVTVTAEGGGEAAAEEKAAKKGRKAKAESTDVDAKRADAEVDASTEPAREETPAE